MGSCTLIEKPGSLRTLEMRMMVGCRGDLHLSTGGADRKKNEKQREAAEDYGRASIPTSGRHRKTEYMK
jgi:hypothetical protein